MLLVFLLFLLAFACFCLLLLAFACFYLLLLAFACLPSASELSLSGATAYARVGIPLRTYDEFLRKMQPELIR